MLRATACTGAAAFVATMPLGKVIVCADTVVLGNPVVVSIGCTTNPNPDVTESSRMYKYDPVGSNAIACAAELEIEDPLVPLSPVSVPSFAIENPTTVPPCALPT